MIICYGLLKGRDEGFFATLARSSYWMIPSHHDSSLFINKTLTGFVEIVILKWKEHANCNDYHSTPLGMMVFQNLVIDCSMFMDHYLLGAVRRRDTYFVARS